MTVKNKKIHRCSQCKREVPERLTATLRLGDRSGEKLLPDCCPVCALKLINEWHSRSRKAFDGQKAEKARLEAVEHYKKTNQ